MSKLLLGKAVADELTSEIIKKVSDLSESNILPKLQIIRVGNRDDDLSYERGALKRMKKCGIEVEVKALAENISEEDFVLELEKSNMDKTVNGILIFRPLPNQLTEEKIKNIIEPSKDIDCFSPCNVAKITEGDSTGFAPCTPAAVIEILKFYNIDITGKNIAIIGRSMVVGKPLSLLLLQNNATVTICHSRTKNLADITSKADIVVAAIGKAKFVDEKFINSDAILIDVGINVDENGKLCGDVDFESCEGKCSMITPVPRGVGSVTTSVLANNLVKACINQNEQ